MSGSTLLGLDIIASALRLAAALTDALSHRGEITIDDIRQASQAVGGEAIVDAQIEARACAAAAAAAAQEGGR